MGKKRLALFLDGTWNNIESKTNVWQMSEALLPAGVEGLEQKPYYDPGPGGISGEKWRGSLGYGLGRNVLEAYSWLVNNHGDGDGDEIYIFGFSRGAYTARSLAGVIATCGMLKPGAGLSVEEIYARYQRGKDVRPIWKLEYERSQGRPVDAEEQRLLASARRVPIRMIGVWDTVGSLGVPFGNFPGLSARRFRFHNTNLSKIYEHAYHAMALDEHRKAFKPTLWTRFRPAVPDAQGASARPSAQVVEQRWFVGAHSNVGGGVPGSDMAALPMAWMRGKAQGLGLAFQPVRLNGSEHRGAISDSFKHFMFGLYSIAGLRPRFHRAVAAPTRTVKNGFSDTINETIDGSVFDRWRSDSAYRPPSLIEWSRRTGLDPAVQAGSIDARSGAPAP